MGACVAVGLPTGWMWRETPLSVAAFNGRYVVVQLLLNAGASPSRCTISYFDAPYICTGHPGSIFDTEWL